MEKKFEDDELDKFLDKELMKEAELIEQALFSDDGFEDYEETDEELNASYQRLVERLKADGIYREDDDDHTDGSDTHGGDEADEANDESGGSHSTDTIMAEEPGQKVVPMPVSDKTKEKRKAGKTHKIAKAAGFVVVGTLCVFAASMTSEANRTYFIDTLQYWMGDDTRIIIDNDDKNDTANSNEYEARDAIESALEIEVPSFFYRPKGFEFKSYEINVIAKFAFIEYQYNDVIISVYIDKKDENSESGTYSLHGEKVDTAYISDESIPVNIFEIRDNDDLMSSYVAQWERDETFYQVCGKLEKMDFINLIEEMRF
ncbi:MAG: DUF4367 domain-containing protein [Eubacteriales bacterium]|nr:DUF4367 domain-containing protein [Eubacteriales bacterium]